MPYYAVKKGKIPGIYKTWLECEENIKGIDKAIFKKFESEEEAKQFVKGTEIKNKTYQDNKQIEKKEITVNTKNLSIDDKYIVNKEHDFDSSINLYIDSIFIGENGDMKAVGSISVYLGIGDNRNELRKMEYEKYKDLTKEMVLYKSILVGLNKVITEIVEEKTIIIHTQSIDCIKYLTNDLIYSKNLSCFELIAKGHMIINKYPNIKFYHNKSTYCTDWKHDCNLYESKKLNLDNLKNFYDKIVFTFGKYKNCTFGKIFISSPDYFDWCLINCKTQLNEIKLFLESKND